MTLPDLTPLFADLTLWLQGIAMGLAVLLTIWSVYSDWTNNPERFSAFSVVWKVIIAAIILVLIYNIEPILNSVSGGGAAP